METIYNDVVVGVLAVDATAQKFLIVDSDDYTWVDITDCKPVTEANMEDLG